MPLKTALRWKICSLFKGYIFWPKRVLWSTNFYIERGGFQPMESKTIFSKYGLKHHLWFLVVTFFLFQVRRTSIMTPRVEKKDRSDLFRRKCVVTWTWEMWHSSVHFRHQAEMRKQERVSILFFTRLYRFRWLGSNILWMKLLLTFWLDIIALFHDCPGEGVILKFAPKSWTFRPEPVLVDDLTGEDSLFSSDTRFFALRQKKGLPVKKQKVGSI